MKLNNRQRSHVNLILANFRRQRLAHFVLGEASDVTGALKTELTFFLRLHFFSLGFATQFAASNAEAREVEDAPLAVLFVLGKDLHFYLLKP